MCGTNQCRSIWADNHDMINLRKTPTNIHWGENIGIAGQKKSKSMEFHRAQE